MLAPVSFSLTEFLTCTKIWNSVHWSVKYYTFDVYVLKHTKKALTKFFTLFQHVWSQAQSGLRVKNAARNHFSHERTLAYRGCRLSQIEFMLGTLRCLLYCEGQPLWSRLVLHSDGELAFQGGLDMITPTIWILLFCLDSIISLAA